MTGMQHHTWNPESIELNPESLEWNRESKQVLDSLTLGRKSVAEIGGTLWHQQIETT